MQDTSKYNQNTSQFHHWYGHHPIIIRSSWFISFLCNKRQPGSADVAPFSDGLNLQGSTPNSEGHVQPSPLVPFLMSWLSTIHMIRKLKSKKSMIIQWIHFKLLLVKSSNCKTCFPILISMLQEGGMCCRLPLCFVPSFRWQYQSSKRIQPNRFSPSNKLRIQRA